MIDRIIEWDSYQQRRYDGIKLLSVLGKSEGKLDYRIHQYRDGSGGWDRCYPFTSYEDAIEHIKASAIKQIEKGNFYRESYEVCNELGISFDKEHLLKFKESITKSLNQTIDSHEQTKNKTQLRIDKIKNDIKNIEEVIK